MAPTTTILELFFELPDAGAKLFTETTKIHHIFLGELPDSNFELAPPPSTGRIFPLFSFLPTELRLQIWKYCCFLPHDISIYRHFIKDGKWPREPGEPQYAKPWRHKFLGLKTVSSNPGVLTTSRESRVIATKIYQPLLEKSAWQPFVRYFNPAVDTVVVDFGREIMDDENDGQSMTFDFVAKLACGAAAKIQKLELMFTVWVHIWGKFQMPAASRDETSCFNVNGFTLNYPGGNDWALFGGLRWLSILYPSFTTGMLINEKEETEEIKDHLVRQFKHLKKKDPDFFLPYIKVEDITDYVAMDLGDTVQKEDDIERFEEPEELEESEWSDYSEDE
ncbi:hypothetical protein HYFRA_00010000 [Hymenoscyphus fraxineus]|uniref:2EXR domain-containing protein n=1 Tax=Hymenoscyphus fraxineus TaxID=746836 RepID=A0A9N9PSL6_9HELO|nr:hypothetical protein HYFRA_00010000 [Hymenoscyphus fraxineus]